MLDDVTPAMRIYAEELFGPVAAIIRVGGADEAVRVANDSEYGLVRRGVRPRRRAARCRSRARMRSGICHINGPTVHDEAQMPFGGVKASGYGRFGGRRGDRTNSPSCAGSPSDPARATIRSDEP